MADTTTTATIPSNETPAQKKLRELMEAMEAVKAEIQAEETARAARVAAEIAAIEGSALVIIEDDIKALLSRKAELIARRDALRPPAPTTTTTTTTTRQTRGDTMARREHPNGPQLNPDGTRKYKWENDSHILWQAYQREFKLPLHKKAMISDICKKHDINMALPSVATLRQIRDLLEAAGHPGK